ncbi:MAG TPA: hypothetical protein VIW70_16825 [Rubrivivax sp.]
MQPLTHHEILALVGPFTRRGRHPDLAASDRLVRRLTFRTVEHGDAVPGLPGLREELQLQNPRPGSYLLTRALTLPGGTEAVLEAEGADPGELLERIESVAAARQLAAGPGFTLARSHRVEAAGSTPPPRLALTRAVAQFDALVLKLRVPAVAGIPASIELVADESRTLALPDDLLAVLGWAWDRIVPARAGWSSTVRLRGSGPARSQDAEDKLQRTVQHLAQTLAESPRRFHERAVRARWRVSFQRTIPLTTCAALVGIGLALPHLGLAQESLLRMLVFHAPPLLLVLGLCMRELPRIEFPRWPRPSRAASWVAR